jgi:ubiquitin-conjugating enzyme E2 J2
MSTQQSAKRLRLELKKLKEDPTPLMLAEPLEDNILEWRFLLQGSADSPYAGGVFMGKIIFPPEYPWKPPAIYMNTPNGRMEVEKRICLSISDYHPESWCPSWTVGTILNGIISFFYGTESTVGSIDTSVDAKKKYASESKAWNEANAIFRQLFGESGDAESKFAEARAQLALRTAAAVAAAARSPGAVAAAATAPVTVLAGATGAASSTP